MDAPTPPPPPPPPPPPVPPVLSEASFDPETLLLTMTFDRAVNLDGLDPAQIIVDAAPLTGEAYQGSGPVEVLSPTQFTLGMSDAGSSGGMAILLLASATTGIVAVDDGGVWEGTGSGVELPYPPPPIPANIVSVAGSEGDTGIAINFDQPIALAPGATPDDAMTFGGLAAVSVWQMGPQTLGAYVAAPVEVGVTPWAIDRQPDWILSPVVFPAGDVIGAP